MGLQYQQRQFSNINQQTELYQFTLPTGQSWILTHILLTHSCSHEQLTQLQLPHLGRAFSGTDSNYICNNLITTLAITWLRKGLRDTILAAGKKTTETCFCYFSNSEDLQTTNRFCDRNAPCWPCAGQFYCLKYIQYSSEQV